MRYIWILGAMGACSGLLCIGFFMWPRAVETDQLDYIMTLSPNSTMIRSQIAALPARSQAKRQAFFAESFTKRFRNHDEKMAVRARFVESSNGTNHIKLMCPARLEPWTMDRLALVTWREAKYCLGQNCDIDVYETFIYAPSRKIGELRNIPGKTPVAQIRHIYDLENQPSPAARRVVPAARIHQSSVPTGVSFSLHPARVPSFSPASVLAPPVR